MGITFESVDKSLKSDQSNGSYRATLFCGVVCSSSKMVYFSFNDELVAELVHSLQVKESEDVYLSVNVLHAEISIYTFRSSANTRSEEPFREPSVYPQY